LLAGFSILRRSRASPARRSRLGAKDVEKQTQIFATIIGSWVIPGVLCAALYLALSLPLAHLARRLEAQWRVPSA
jgi:ABC-type amino acid transport system permease subunit